MTIPLHLHIDRLINFTKWPAALASLVILLPSAITLLDVSMLFLNNRGLGLALLTGIFVVAAPLIKRRRLPNSSFWLTFEHEMTHLFFALMCLHPIHSLQITSNNGGSVEHGGRGNWLVTVSPYFFPTFPLLVGSVSLTLPPSFKVIGIGFVGFAFAWHLVSTVVEIHAKQSDLNQVGFIFAIAFVPGVSMLGLGFVLAVAGLGVDGSGWFFAKYSRHFANEIYWIRSLQ